MAQCQVMILIEDYQDERLKGLEVTNMTNEYIRMQVILKKSHRSWLRRKAFEENTKMSKILRSIVESTIQKEKQDLERKNKIDNLMKSCIEILEATKKDA